MKRHFVSAMIILFISILFIYYNNSRADQKFLSSHLTDTDIYFPYNARYSAGFGEGKVSNLKTVLDSWKQYETGNLMNMSPYLSDTIQFVFPDEVIWGRKDTVLKKYLKRRKHFEYMQCYIDSWMPVQTKDKGDDLVFIWGIQDGTTLSGKRDYKMVHEVWQFDKKGKIFKMTEYITKPH